MPTPSSNPQAGRLFLRSHGDCFIHATVWWIRYWNYRLTKELAIVRVTLPTEESFLATLCPTPLPYENVQKGVNRKQYLEIDPKFAQALNISPDTEVLIESIHEVEECNSLVIAPEETTDYDKLDNFSEKIDYELTDRIRVVSCHLTFPIWIDNLVIHVKVLSSDPSAKWVVLVPGMTKVEVHVSETSSMSSGTGTSTVSSMTTPVQCSTNSAGSLDGQLTETSNSTLSVPTHKQSTKKVWDFTSNYSQKKLARRSSQKSNVSSNTSNNSDSSVDTSPDDSDFNRYSITSLLSNAYRLFTRESRVDQQEQGTQKDSEHVKHGYGTFTNSLDSEGFIPINEDFTHPTVSIQEAQDNVTPPHSTETVSSSGSSLLGSSQSSPHKHVMNELKHMVPVYIGPSIGSDEQKRGTRTPDSHPPSKSNDLAVKPTHRRWKTWHSETDFNRQPIPSRNRLLAGSVGTPQMCVNLRVQPHVCSGIRSFKDRNKFGLSSGLWSQEKLFDIFVHPSTIPEIFILRQFLNDKEVLVEIQSSGQKFVQIKEGKNSKVLDQLSTVQEDLMDLKEDPRSVSAEKFNDGSTVSVSPQPDSLVVRLCFATHIQLRGGEMETRIEDGPSEEKEKYVEEEPKYMEEVDFSSHGLNIQVQVGHVIMSDVVRQQLNIKACSQIKLLHVKDSWRVPYADNPSLILQPLKTDEKHSSAKIRSKFQEWITAVSNVASVGGIIVNRQIIPIMQNDKDDWIYCHVRINRAKSRVNSNARIAYLLVTPVMIEQNKLSVHIDSVSTSGRQLNYMKPVFSRQTRNPSPVQEEAVKLPSMKELNQPPVCVDLDQFGGLDSLYNEGVQYLKTVFSKPGKRGALLVCGMSGSGGSGCGKSSLAKLFCKHLSAHPYYANMASVDCTAMRGLTTHNFKKKLKAFFSEAICNQPSVILLDDLDHPMPLIADAQEQVGEEGNASNRKTQVLLDLVEDVHHRGAQVVVIATAQNKQQLNKDLLQSRGVHVFEKILEIYPPNLTDRKEILNAILYSKEIHTMKEHGLRSVALKTEGFQAGDLVTLVDRAISLCELRTLYPQGVRLPSHMPSSPDKTFRPPIGQRTRGLASTSSNESEPVDPSLAASPPVPIATPSSPPLATPPKYHIPYLIKTQISPSCLMVHKDSVTSSDSTHTLTLEDSVKGLSESRLQLHKSTSLSQMRLCVEDFDAGLNGFVPVSLRGLHLHKSGSIDFSGVGGLETVKKSLKETLLWPSRYPKLFSQCPIKQRCGILLYGPPGTGKTMLAGAVAKEFGLNFVSIKGPELLSKYIGASEQAVRDVFTRALSAKPCILFFDEFDSLAPKRGHDNTGVTDRVVNQLLTQLDGVESITGVYVLAASSRPDLIDPALLRPGRIDRNLLCSMPTEYERTRILISLSRSMPLGPDVDLKKTGLASSGLTGADLKAVLYNAQLQAAHEGLKSKKAETENSMASGGLCKPLVFEGSVCPVKQDTELSTTLVSKVTAIQESNKYKRHCQRRRRGSTLTWEEDGGLKKEQFKKAKNVIRITQQHLDTALELVQPSVPERELQKYDQIYGKFTGEIKTATGDIKPKATMA